ncbi:UNVERIFIED_CONTAM: hypothetical protein HDU68_009748 [Siphonaria sp. JEL0065]|nr:hypothetical protein HDU68_009748 [Siphonaria sp. JEL0065]
MGKADAPKCCSSGLSSRRSQSSYYILNLRWHTSYQQQRTQKSAAPKKEKGEKVPRAPSAYNLFMKTELPKVKAENPALTHKEAFKVAAGNWKDSDENPANKK